MSTRLTEELDQRLERLPPFPEAATRALQELGRDISDFKRLENVLGSDPVLTARILRIANSPFYGLPRKIVAIKDACILTGAPTLRNLIVAAAAMRQFPVNKSALLDRAALWRHSAQCAAFAAELAPVARQARDLAFTTGLLHDIGKLAIDALFPEECARIRERGETLSAEIDVLGATHADIGARVAELWRLPPAIRDAIAAHHAPLPGNGGSLANVIYAANVLTHAMDDGVNGTEAWSRLPDTVLACFTLPADAREALYVRAQTLAAAAAELFTAT